MRTLILAAMLFSSGCATVYTVTNAEQGVVIKGSNCDEIQHVMSGTSHNICSFYGEPGDTDGTNTENKLYGLLVDSVFSLVADVVVLPYSLFKQVTSPAIKVKSYE